MSTQPPELRESVATPPRNHPVATGLHFDRRQQHRGLRVGPSRQPYRLRLGTRPHHLPADPLDLKLNPERIDQPLHNICRWRHAKRTGRRAGPDAEPAMADPSPGYAVPSLAPDPSSPRQPERRQITHTEVAYVSVGARHPTHTSITIDRTNPTPPPRGVDPLRPPHRLTRTTAS